MANQCFQYMACLDVLVVFTLIYVFGSEFRLKTKVSFTSMHSDTHEFKVNTSAPKQDYKWNT